MLRRRRSMWRRHLGHVTVIEHYSTLLSGSTITLFTLLPVITRLAETVLSNQGFKAASNIDRIHLYLFYPRFLPPSINSSI